MRFSQLYAPTLKEDPAEAEITSHKLMLRAGMIRKLAAGIYSYLPLGYRSIRKVEQIVREEMDRAGAQEVLLPAVQPAELWEESGRWSMYGPDLLRLKDRHQRDFCFGPTHEEVITDLVRHEIRSYRDLPKNLYQIQTKFRDEIRPRFGLMRGREFIMKDAYSFDVDNQSSEESYRKMYEAYSRIFKRCGLEFRAVEADSGNIGGSFSHEFMVLASSGEDAIVSCDTCDYAANVEKAELPDPGEAAIGEQELEKVATPGKTTIEEVSAFLGLTSDQLVKTLIFDTSHGPVAALVRGDHEVNEIKLGKVLEVNYCEPAEAELVAEVTKAPVGFAGPIGLDLPLIADFSLRTISDFVVGANQKDTHYRGVNSPRDFKIGTWADIRKAGEGDPCPRCSGKLREFRGVEVGHIFKLGAKYSDSMGATFLDEEGKEQSMIMGCYGIGVSRTVAATIEQNHDENGICFPVPVAPYEVLICSLYAKKGRDEVNQASERLYDELNSLGVEVLWDDRDERPGAKFKDADLIGIPLRITVGLRGLQEGQVEFKLRTDKEFSLIPLEEVAAKAAKLIQDKKHVED